MVVARTGTTSCVDGTDLVIDPATDEPDNLSSDRMVDWAEKSWETPVATALQLDPETATNTHGQDHLVTGTVVDEFGDPAPAGVDVRSQVYRRFVGDDGDTEGALTREEELTATTDADGVVELTYTGPLESEFAPDARDGDGEFDGSQDADTAEDTIVGCVGVTAHDDCSQIGGDGELAVNPDAASDQLGKTWAPVETGVEDGTYTGQALRQDRLDNTFVMLTDDDRFIEFVTGQGGSDDEFTVDGDASADREARWTVRPSTPTSRTSPTPARRWTSPTTAASRWRCRSASTSTTSPRRCCRWTPTATCGWASPRRPLRRLRQRRAPQRRAGPGDRCGLGRLRPDRGRGRVHRHRRGDVGPDDADWQFGASATIGVQQGGDGPSTRYLFNQEAIFDGEALRFDTS